MAEPLRNLVLFGVLLLLLAVLAWPRLGVVARLARLRRQSERVRVEDALKHLYHGEDRGERRSLDSVAAALRLTPARALPLVVQLESLGLVRSGADGLSLTDDGRVYALHVVRSHRLWERFLADRTDVDPTDWHAQAERREHTLTRTAVEHLSARLGHPRYDPHGDPIPTAHGDVPPSRGIPINALDPGAPAAIVHLEDEPREVFDRLVAEGLAPGMRITLIEKTAERIRFRTGGREHTVEPVVALNITVQRLPGGTAFDEPLETLETLTAGGSATVVDVSPACRGPQRRRLLDLGVVPGTEIRAEMQSALGDPVAYRIRGALVALRRDQAQWITIVRSRTGAGR